MKSPWPVADFDQVRRLRVLAAGISGARVAERLIPAPFERVWAIVADLENEFGTFEPDMRRVVVRQVGDRTEAYAQGRLGLRARFDVDLELGWCWMQSRFLMIGIAAAPAPGGTLVAATGGIRVPGRAALLPVTALPANRRALRRLAARATG
ncbi:hypothetical protein ACEZDB_20340 [Streptacidiphilus sp. N1-3]|uniref:Polyketide cyclase / dehydrase and lipid transport n=1 Tax=Streptacidiphilus alkalitolerans TaxID=3342712 RepID=A0ABV6X3X2_9ACTN